MVFANRATESGIAISFSSMLRKHGTLLSAVVLAFAIGAVPAAADDDQCDKAKLAEIVKASGVTTKGAAGAIDVVSYYAPNACAIGRRDMAMVRGMMTDAYGAADSDEGRKAALMTAKALADNAGMGCVDKDPAALLVLDKCSLDDVEKALKGDGTDDPGPSVFKSLKDSNP